MSLTPDSGAHYNAFRGREEAASLAAASLIAFATILVSTWAHGAGLTADSGVYLSAAENLRAGRGLVHFGGAPYVTGPPLLPALLAAVPSGTQERARAAGWIGAAAFACVAALTIPILGRCCERRGTALLGSILLLVSSPFSGVFTFLWTEPLFIAFTATFLLAAQRRRERGGGWALAALILSAAAAALTRYIGAAVIASGAILILLEPERSARERLRASALFTALSSLPLALWIARNVRLAGEAAGERGASVYSIVEILRSTADTAAGWLGAGNLEAPAKLLLVMAAAGAVLLAWLFPGSSGRGRPAAPGVPGEPSPTPRGDLTVPALFAAVYLAFLVAAAAVTGFDRIDDRLLSPAFVPLLAIAVAAAERISLRVQSGPGAGRLVRALLLAGAALWIAGSGARSARSLWLAAAEGPGGFNTSRWRGSDLAAWLRGHAEGGILLCDEPAAAYLLAGRDAIQSPRRTLYHSTVEAPDLARLERWIAEGRDVRLAWFDGIEAGHLYRVEEIAARVQVSLLYRARDGAVFSLSRRPG